MQDWQQWHSPFAQAAPPPPRLKPNLFSRLTRTALHHQPYVLFGWLALVVVCAALALFLFPSGREVPSGLSLSAIHGERLAELEAEFPNLDGLMTINLASTDTALRQAAVNRIARALEAETTLFHTVIVPGVGPYYERNALLYLPPAAIGQRVDGALALAPLFRAIAAKPSVAGLNLLLKEVAASVEQGREPEGLDRLFAASGAAIRSVIAGAPAELDWREVAGLSVDAGGARSMIIAWPLTGQNQNAAAMIRRQLALVAPPGGAIAASVEGLPVSPEKVTDLPLLQWVAGLGMGLAFVAAVFLFLFGELRLSALVSLPVVAALAPASLLAVLIWPQAPRDLWLIPVAAGPLLLPLAIHFAVSMIEADDGYQSAAASWMLAAHREGPRIAALALALGVMWLAWVVTGPAVMRLLVPVIAVALVAGFAAALTLTPGLLRLLRRAWPVVDPTRLDPNRWALPEGWEPWRRPVAVTAALVAFVGLTLVSPLRFSADQRALSGHGVASAVQILADSPDAAEAKIARLREAQGVGAVRWLGAFLPAEAGEKLVRLQPLKDAFPRANPTAMAEMDLTSQELFTGLENNLKTIANSPQVPPELSAAAHDFRRSLLLLEDQTGNSDVAMLRLETLLFARFDQLATTANLLAGLDQPGVADLDPRLKELFLSPNGVYRLSVEPVPGLSAAALAEKLEDFGLAPVDRVLAAAKAAAELQRLFFIASLLGLMAGAGIILIVTRRIVSWAASMGSFVAGAMAAWALLAWSGVIITLQNLPMLMTGMVMGFTLNMLPLFRIRHGVALHHPSLMNLEGAGLFLVVVACATPLFLVGSPMLFSTAAVLVLPLIAFALMEILVRGALAQELGVLAARFLRGG